MTGATTALRRPATPAIFPVRDAERVRAYLADVLPAGAPLVEAAGPGAGAVVMLAPVGRKDSYRVRDVRAAGRHARRGHRVSVLVLPPRSVRELRAVPFAAVEFRSIGRPGDLIVGPAPSPPQLTETVPAAPEGATVTAPATGKSPAREGSEGGTAEGGQCRELHFPYRRPDQWAGQRADQRAGATT